MQDSKFWRFAAVLMIAAALYVGHGLHNGGREGVPSLVNAAHAGGVVVDSIPLQNGVRSFARIYTSDESGTRLYVWDVSAIGSSPEYLFTVLAPEKRIAPPKTARQQNPAHVPAFGK
jgi:hypothetical protein